MLHFTDELNEAIASVKRIEDSKTFTFFHRHQAHVMLEDLANAYRERVLYIASIFNDSDVALPY